MASTWIPVAWSQPTEKPSVFAELSGEPPPENLEWRREENGVRVLMISPTGRRLGTRKLVVFATPNGNTLEQTLGCKPQPGLDWRFDIQHIAAQYRALQVIDPSAIYMLAVVQAPHLSWPAFRQETPNANTWIRNLVESLQDQSRADETILGCHSGGGSFLWGWINAHAVLPDRVSRLLFLDANYSFSDDDRHGDKLLTWLNSNPSHRLEVIAYDDREITLNGKKVVGEDGGTFRATDRMKERFQKDLSLSERRDRDFQVVETVDRRLQLIVHANPDNQILHTRLVGEMNGFLYAMLAGTRHENASQWGGPRAYEPFVPPQPFVDPFTSTARHATELPNRTLMLPTRPVDSESGMEFIARVAKLDRKQRENEILLAVRGGNVPAYARVLLPIEVAIQDMHNQKRSAIYYATADYMAIGSDRDSVRIPMTPTTALAIGKCVDCTLITPKLSDDLFAASQVRLEPIPLTQDREEPATFLQHHQAIESQLKDRGANDLIAGIKKDIVYCRKLLDKPHRVAIFGWHRPNGRPIQPVYAGHADRYTDYSHGLRLLQNQLSIDGTETHIQAILKDPDLHRLLSNEGTLDLNELKNASQW